MVKNSALSVCIIALYGTIRTVSCESNQGCCVALEATLPGKVVFPNNAAYTAVNLDYWSLTSVLHPSCIVLPTSAHDVSSALTTLERTFTEFAIKSGGHTANVLANNIDRAVTIDLGWINETKLSDDRSYVRLGAGSRWIHAYNNINSQDVASPGGRCGSTGVGGLTLGGGISYYAAKVGFVADNVINFEVVHASGKIVNANRSSNNDLYTALKGGGSNFAVVTRFDVAVFEMADKIWGGAVVSPVTENVTSQTLKALSDFTNNNYADKNAAIDIVFSYNTTTGDRAVARELIYTAELADPDILKPLAAIQPQTSNNLGFTTMSSLANQASGGSPAGFRDFLATVAFVNDVASIERALDLSDRVFETVSHIKDMVWSVYFEPLPHLFTEHSLDRGGNVLGLNRTQDNLILLLLNPRWQDQNDDDEMARAARAWVHNIRKSRNEVEASQSAESFEYLPYADDFQHPLRSYGVDSMDFMRHISTKYDPHQVFQELMPGGFKIDPVNGLDNLQPRQL